MSVYFLLLDGRRFAEDIVPPLATAWRQRSLTPCRGLCESLLPTLNEFRASFFAGPEEPLLALAARGLPFDRHVWRALVGEVLLFAAADVPELETAPDTLCRLLTSEQYREETVPRERFAPIQQAHFGTRELSFGSAVYRPDYVGMNNGDETARLAEYLSGVDPHQWRVADLVGLRGVEEEDLAEELEYVREWFPALVALYQPRTNRNRWCCARWCNIRALIHRVAFESSNTKR